MSYNAAVAELETLFTGSCSFTASGWERSFYPPGTRSSGYLGFYSRQYRTVEVDATFYGVPAEKTVQSWFEQTPDDFVFACKVPQVITHEACLVDCDELFRSFLNVMSGLEHKLGPLLLQFPYFSRKTFDGPAEFLRRLEGFLPKLPGEFRFALEIRNKAWVTPEFLGLLRKHKVAFALIDHPYMSRPAELLSRFDAITSDFAYIRLLGDRYAIEKLSKTWDHTLIDRRRELAEWSGVVEQLLAREMKVYTYVNNHFEGFSPDTLREFMEMLRRRGRRQLPAATER